VTEQQKERYAQSIATSEMNEETKSAALSMIEDFDLWPVLELVADMATMEERKRVFAF